MEMRHEIEVELDGQPSMLLALGRIDDNDQSLIIHDISVSDIMMGTVYPDCNEHTGCTDWKSDSGMALELVEQGERLLNVKTVNTPESLQVIRRFHNKYCNLITNVNN